MDAITVARQFDVLVTEQLGAHEAALPESLRNNWLTKLTAAHIVFSPHVEQLLIPFALLLLTLVFVHSLPIVLLILYLAVKFAPAWVVVIAMTLSFMISLAFALFVAGGFLRSLRLKAVCRGFFQRLLEKLELIHGDRLLRNRFRWTFVLSMVGGVATIAAIVIPLKTVAPTIILIGFAWGLMPFWGIGALLLCLGFARSEPLPTKTRVDLLLERRR